MIERKMALAGHAIRLVQELEPWWPLSPGQIRHRLLAAGRMSGTPEDADDMFEALAIAARTGDIPREAVALAGALTPSLVWGAEPRRMPRGDGTLGGAPPPRIDLQAGQPRRVVVIVTNRGLAAAVEPFCADWSVPVFVPLFAEASHGAKRWLGPIMVDAAALSTAGPVTALVLDDYDVENDAPLVPELFAGLEACTNQLGGDLRIHHLAVTIHDVERFGPFPKIQAAFFSGGRILDVISPEALEPGTLRAVLASAIEAELDMDLFRARVDHERALHVGQEMARQSEPEQESER